MPVNLDQPLEWTKADAEERAMLADLQGNILKGHGRHATLNLFVDLGSDRDMARDIVRTLGARTTSALEQLEAAEAHKAAVKEDRAPGTTATFVSLLLSDAGYAKLGLTPPDNDAFRAGMAARAAILNDNPEMLEPQWRERPDAMVLIAADPDAEDSWLSDAVSDEETAITNIVIGRGGQIAHKQPGRAVFRSHPDSAPEGIEHFGYVDGRSQPLLLVESIAAEPGDIWDPAFPLKQVLVPDPGSAEGAGFGSYFVFRKLEQHVAAFKLAEEALGKSTDTKGNELGEAAGAMLVGRFEDGTAVTEHCTAQSAKVPNDFDYRDDMEGLRCPFHAHIRKTNPRGDTARLFGGGDPAQEAVTLARERRVIMARRGITYGERDRTLDPTDRPDRGVGLLFMAYQSSLVDQFEFTQQSWANSPLFAPGHADPDRAPGRDPIIGQRHGGAPATIKVAHGCNDPTAPVSDMDFAEHVTFRGGEYFFAPARSTLINA